MFDTNDNSLYLFQELSPEDYKSVMKVVETAILSTDLAMYFKKRNKFLELIDNGEFDWQSDDKKECTYPNTSFMKKTHLVLFRSVMWHDDDCL